MQRALGDLERVRVVAVMPGSPELLHAIGTKLGLTMPLLSDPTWTVHGHFQMRRGSRRDIFFSLATWKAYARLFRRWNTTKPTEDVFELGGAALIDSDGVLALVHRNTNPADYADPAEIARLAAALRN